MKPAQHQTQDIQTWRLAGEERKKKGKAKEKSIFSRVKVQTRAKRRVDTDLKFSG